VTLLPGLWVSLELTFASLAIGLPLGLILALIVRSPRTSMRIVGLIIVEAGRGTPALMLLYLAYFGLPQVHVTLPQFAAASLALGASAAAYSSEIFRAGLQAIPRGQREAARAVGLGPWEELRLVVLPQAVRLVIPPVLGYAIIVFQGTSLAFVIGMPELLSVGYSIGTITFEMLSVLLLVGLLYASITIPASQLVAWVERRAPVRR
jgi:polar amino acid transport system permease protein